MTVRTNERAVYEIASEIVKHWPKINYAAKPYLMGMLTMTTVDDPVGFDSGRGTILRFLNNAGSFNKRIYVNAPVIKKELNNMLKAAS